MAHCVLHTHKEIQDLARIRWEECTHPNKNKIFDINCSIGLHIAYDDTPEQSSFWISI